MKRPVTTVILFFNKPAMTIRCATSVRSALQSYTSRSDLFLVDNGSTFAASEAVRQSFHERVHRIAVNKGFAGGMNFGLQKAFETGAGWCVALSNDTELNYDFYGALDQIEIPCEQPVILCPSVYWLKKKSDLAYRYGSFNGSRTGFSTLSHHSDEIRTIRPPHYYPAAATVWNRAAYEKLGGFDERYACYWEDVDLSYECARTEVALLSAPQLAVFHLGKGTTAGKAIYAEHFMAGEKKFREKWEINYSN